MSTDWHFGKSNGKFDQIILEGIRQQCMHAKKHGITTLINLGDTLESKQTIGVGTLNMLAEAFKLLRDAFDDIYVLVGNHDMSKRTYDEHGHNLHILSGFDMVKLVDTPQIIDIGGKNFYMLPYLPSDMLQGHNFKNSDYMCGHIEVKGFMLNQFVKSEEGILLGDIAGKYNEVFLGHFHKKQTSKNINYIGNMCRFFYGEDDDPRGWTVLDTESNTTEFVEYLHPRMFKFKLTDLLNDVNYLKKILPGDNVKLVIDNNFKYSVLEELKESLTLTYKVGSIVLDDQYFAWDDLGVLEEDTEIDSDDSTLVDMVDEAKKKQDQSYMDYVIGEIIKVSDHSDDKKERESIKYLRELSKQFQD